MIQINMLTTLELGLTQGLVDGKVFGKPEFPARHIAASAYRNRASGSGIK